MTETGITDTILLVNNFLRLIASIAVCEGAGFVGAFFESIRRFSKINSTAARLLYPYVAWVSFATILNFSIWWLNR